MREVLYEESSNPSNLSTHKFIYITYSVIMWVMIVIAALFIMFGFYLSTPMLITGVFFVFSAVLFGFLRKKIYYCVDVSFVSGSTRIVKVVNYKRRKKIMVFDANEVVQVGKITSQSFLTLSNTPKMKIVYATPNKYIDEGFYVQVFQGGINHLVILDCKEDYLQHLVMFTGKKVIEKDYK